LYNSSIPENDYNLENDLFKILIEEIEIHEKNLKKNQGKLYKKYPLMEEIILSVLCPKLDEKVLVRADHLLK